MFNRIKQCDNLDGPGFSERYINKRSLEISRASGKMNHYKWSLVGDSLYSLPGEHIEFFGIDKDQHKDNIFDRIRYLTVRRHDTASLVFDESGRALRGKQDRLAKVWGDFSRGTDKFIKLGGLKAIYNLILGHLRIYNKNPQAMVQEQSLEALEESSIAEGLRVLREGTAETYDFLQLSPQVVAAGVGEIGDFRDIRNEQRESRRSSFIREIIGAVRGGSKYHNLNQTADSYKTDFLHLPEDEDIEK